MNALERPPVAPCAPGTWSTSSSPIANPADAFARAIRALITRNRLRKIVETGTGNGLGTTLVVCHALYELNLPLSKFYSLESNPALYQQACDNLAVREFQPHLLLGLSIPRAQLPNAQEIHRDTIEQLPEGILADYPADQRVESYQKQTPSSGGLDDLLGYVLRSFDHRPDLVLLDSVGHLGLREFQYALSLIEGPCYIALQGVCHVKHYRSLKLIQGDPRFTMLELCREQAGYCVVEFTPHH